MDAESITLYETQLSQLQAALAASQSEEERTGLQCLCKEITDLIALTKDSQKASQLDEEYLLFKAELADEVSQPAEIPTPDITDELKSLQGMKCQAPYRHKYESSLTYHNAMVTSVVDNSTLGATDTSHIQVRVIFINPMNQAMKLCPYYLDGRCKFSDEKCRYSHGHVVSLSELQEYAEPDFATVQKGSRVLACGTNEIWSCATVQDVTGHTCYVKFEDSGLETALELRLVLPIQGDLEESDSSDDDLTLPDEHDPELVNNILLNKGPDTKLGAWEQHTRGIGSKLMAKMGYITGAGLGKRGDGKIEPVETLILPPGKSLDHCMHLKESTGDMNLFKAEKKQRRQRLKMLKQQQKQYEREKKKSTGTVFDFINNYLAPTTSKASTSSTSYESKRTSAADTSENLNVRGFQISEEIRRTEREVDKLGQSAVRTGNKSINSNLKVAQEKLDGLRREQRSIELESKRRQDKQKMSVF